MFAVMQCHIMCIYTNHSGTVDNDPELGHSRTRHVTVIAILLVFFENHYTVAFLRTILNVTLLTYCQRAENLNRFIRKNSDKVSYGCTSNLKISANLWKMLLKNIRIFWEKKKLKMFLADWRLELPCCYVG